jgi:hypothetical protein
LFGLRGEGWFVEKIFLGIFGLMTKEEISRGGAEDAEEEEEGKKFFVWIAAGEGIC